MSSVEEHEKLKNKFKENTYTQHTTATQYINKHFTGSKCTLSFYIRHETWGMIFTFFFDVLFYSIYRNIELSTSILPKPTKCFAVRKQKHIWKEKGSLFSGIFFIANNNRILIEFGSWVGLCAIRCNDENRGKPENDVNNFLLDWWDQLLNCNLCIWFEHPVITN